MSRHGSRLVMVSVAVALVGLAGCARGAGAPEATSPESAGFAALQARGQEAMGVDQYTSTHLFDALPGGGRIELQRDLEDPAGVAQIRQHLQEIARAFQSGDFSTPAFVHMQSVPGTEVMAAKHDAISYEYRELPRGGEVHITTRDPEALAAIHEFMAFQREDHRAGGLQEHGEHTAASGQAAPNGDASDHAAMHGPGGMGMGMGMHAAMHGPEAAQMHGGTHEPGAAQEPGGAPHTGMMQMHMGGDSAFQADMELVHALLMDHKAIERTVTDLPNGVRAVTESQNPQVAAYIKEHVGSMMTRLAEGEVFNVASSTIPLIFANADKIRTELEETSTGVVFTQTTDVPELVPVLRAHADEVSELVREGMAAMMRSMMQRAGTTSPGAPRP